jgi:hypothetical protein
MAQQPVNSMSNSEPQQLIIMNSKEKDSLSSALPIEWTTPQHLGEVTLYSGKLSPSCCKIRTILAWYIVGVNFVCHVDNFSFQKFRPDIILSDELTRHEGAPPPSSQRGVWVTAATAALPRRQRQRRRDDGDGGVSVRRQRPVKFRVVEGGKPGSEYKKVPWLFTIAKSMIHTSW